MEFLQIASMGFLVVLLGTLFLFGELLVKVKGLFGLLGVAIMTFYFSYHLVDGGTGLWIVLLYVLGLILIIFDGKVTNDGNIALLGLVLMILGLAIPTPNFIYGALVTFGFLLGAFGSLLFLKVLPPRNLWSKMTLKERLTSDLGYNSMNESYRTLVGKKGRTITPFRPTGNIDIEGKNYSATSDGQWLEANVEIEVVSVDGTRIVVKKLINDKEEEPSEL
ncbi:NfeD family protein [Anaerobacillus sp. MEB173]|uniref:NfeD family protein n=1 Tax=Anaerobacillus sp. MEB173 TaxID=3383345 RepID=UPI003F905C55